MTLDEIDQLCTALPGCEVRYPFDSDVRAWCIGKKMFAWCATSRTPLEIQIKADTTLVPYLVENYEFILPGYHMNKRHWITVRGQDCPDDMLTDLIEDSHILVARSLPNREQIRLLGD